MDVEGWPDENYKGRLQEVTEERFLSTPQYDIVGDSGPGHRREYTAEVSFGNGVTGKGRGRTKRDAEQMAAREALAALGALEHPPAPYEVLEALPAHAANRCASNHPPLAPPHDPYLFLFAIAAAPP